MMLLTSIATDNRSKRYIFASASLGLVLAVIGLVCGFFDTLKPPEGPPSNLEEEEETKDDPCPSYETSGILVEKRTRMARGMMIPQGKRRHSRRLRGM